MTDKAVALPGHAGFIKNNLRNYGMLLSLFAIMLFFQVMTDEPTVRCVLLTVHIRHS
jgi:putative multiple sugar transport system permease protein